MRVTLPAGLVATDLFTLGRFGEVGLTTGDLLRIPQTLEQAAANDRDRITLDDARSTQNVAALPYTVGGDGRTLPRAGDALSAPVTDVFSYAFGEYRVQPTVAGATAAFTRLNPRTTAPGAVGGDMQVASFNVLNYFVDFGGANRGARNATELARQQAKLVSASTALDADVVGLIEIANDDGDALETLVRALNDAQSDAADDYTAVLAPALNTPTSLGGTYGTDAIRTAIVYRAAVVAPAGPPPSDRALLHPVDPRFPSEELFDRPPAVQAFAPVGGGQSFTVVVNHWKSKGSTNAQCGTPDPLAGNCDDLRERQAAGTAALADRLDDDVLLLGDLNAYEGEEPLAVLERAGYVSLTKLFVADADRYSYSFDGEFGELDHAFASRSFVGEVTGADIWHVNSAEAPAHSYGSFNQPLLFAPDAFASSDHDPVLLGLALAQPPVADAGEPYRTRVGRVVVLDASGSADPDGDVLTYAWDLDGDGAFDDATGPTVRFGRGVRPGRYPVAVQVSDGSTTVVDTALVTVTAASGRVPPGHSSRTA